MYGIEPTDSPLDLNELLIHKPAATFFIRAKGDSMKDAGIFDGDILIIDRSITPRHNQVILASLCGEFKLRRLHQKSNIIRLIPENSKYKAINITEGMDFKVWGVALTCIHYLK